jgi:hypothetical protein
MLKALRLVGSTDNLVFLLLLAIRGDDLILVGGLALTDGDAS